MIPRDGLLYEVESPTAARSFVGPSPRPAYLIDLRDRYREMYDSV